MRSDPSGLLCWLSPQTPLPYNPLECSYFDENSQRVKCCPYSTIIARFTRMCKCMNPRRLPYTYTHFHCLRLNFDSVRYEFILSSLGTHIKVIKQDAAARVRSEAAAWGGQLGHDAARRGWEPRESLRNAGLDGTGSSGSPSPRPEAHPVPPAPRGQLTCVRLSLTRASDAFY